MLYKWSPKYIHSTCVGGKRFEVDHALLCQKGGFIHRRHDEVKELIGHIWQMSYTMMWRSNPILYQTPVKYHITQPTDNKKQDSSPFKTFGKEGNEHSDVRILNHFAQTHLRQKLENSFSNNEKEKKRSYGQRVIDVEHGSFTPLIFSSHWGYRRETDRFFSVLAEKLSTKKDISYGETVA